MNRTRRLLLVVSVAAVLVASAGLGWHSLAAQGQGKTSGTGVVAGQADSSVMTAPVPGGPGFYAQSAFLFMRWDQDSPYAYDRGNGAELYNPGAGFAAYDAPLSLPHGATITKFVAYYYDASAYNIQFTLFRVPLDGQLANTLGSVNSTSQSGYGFGEDTSINLPLVDLQSYSYVVQVSLPAGDAVRATGFRIDYTYSANLPAVLNSYE